MANCVGFIDVNGPNSPNKEVTCKNADDTALNPSATCAPASAIGDVFPVVFHDGIVEPASNAARAVLSAGKGSPATGEDTASSSGGSTPEPEPQYTEIGHHKIGKRGEPSTWEPFEITTPLTKAQCEELIGEEYGIKACNYESDYWAAAVKECGGVRNMLTQGDLDALAETLFNECDKWHSCTDFDSSKVPENLSGLGSSWYYLWLGSEYSSTNASRRYFSSSTSGRDNPNRYYSTIRAVCVEPKTE